MQFKDHDDLPQSDQRRIPRSEQRDIIAHQRRSLARVLRLRPSNHLGNFQPAQVGIIRPALTDDRQRRKKVTSGSNRRKRHHVERFRTDDAEHEALKALLQARGLGLGDYVMQLGKITARKTARPRRRERATIDAVALMQAVVAFNRAGGNLNQVARALNELLMIAREQSNARLESMVEEQADAICGLPALFAAPVAAIMAAMHHDRER